MSKTGSNSSLQKGLQLLHLFTPNRPARKLGDISREAAMPKATALRFLNALVSMGFLRRDLAGWYRLGYRLIELGHLAAEQVDLRTVAAPFMTALRDKFGEAVQIAVLDGNEAVYIEKVECQQPVRLFTRVGRRAPLHAGACPRLLLAYADDGLVEELIASGLWSFTEATPIDADDLRRILAETRRNGYSLSYGELEPGSAALAVPIRDFSDKVIATLSVAGPSDRFGAERIPAILVGAQETAQAISVALGRSEA
jgi:IclR family KDG regulon transcriptional repressor